MTIAQLSNGIEIEYKYLNQLKDAETIVVINGTFNVLQDWEAVVAPYSNHYNVLTFDLRNQGGSTKVKEDFQYEDILQDITLLLDSLNINVMTLITYSSGSSFAVDYIVRNPGKVKRLIMGAPVVNPYGMFKNQLISQASNRFFELGADLKDIVKLSFPLMVSGRFVEAVKHDFDAILEGFSTSYDKVALSRFMKAWDQNEMTLAKLQQVVESTKTYYICGDEDIFNAPLFVEQLREGVPGIQFFQLSSGHAFHMENMEGFLNLLKTILLSDLQGI